MIVLSFASQINNDAATPAGHGALKSKVIFCVRGVISPLLANIYLHYVYDLWANHWRQRQATGDVIFVRYADDSVVGFEQQRDAERFLADLRERLARFALSLHPDKTRLLEFGGHAAQRRAGRGEGTPETFDFLGFTHICGANRKSEGFQLWRKSSRKRLKAKLQATKEEMRKRMRLPIAEQGRWLGSVLSGFFAYHAVPTNYARIDAFRFHSVRAWVRTLRRRGQNRPMTWEKMQRHIDRYLPKARVLHPWPERRFRVRHSGWEPYAGTRPVRFCAGAVSNDRPYRDCLKIDALLTNPVT